MGWLNNFIKDLSANVKKEWDMSDTSNQAAPSAVTTISVDQAMDTIRLWTPTRALTLE